MIIETVTVTAFQQHTRVIGCEQTKLAICLDPGDDSDAIVEAIDRHGFILQAIGCTHAHLDHVGGVAGLKKRKPDANIIIHAADEPIYDQLPRQPAWLGIPESQWAAYGLAYDQPPKVDENWTDGQDYQVGKLTFRVIHCPGHTPGHVVLFEPTEMKVFVGDCLFAGSIGRTDLPGGSTEQLMDSLFNKILPLGDEVEVLSGHGPNTTIGYERRTNPFLTGTYSIGSSGRR